MIFNNDDIKKNLRNIRITEGFGRSFDYLSTLLSPAFSPDIQIMIVDTLVYLCQKTTTTPIETVDYIQFMPLTWTRYSHSVAGAAKACKGLFRHLLKKGEKTSQFAKAHVLKIMLEEPLSKGISVFMVELIKDCGTNLVVQRKGYLEHAVSSMKDPSLSSCVGKLIFEIIAVRKEEVAEDEWNNFWTALIPPNLEDPQIGKAIRQYILPPLFRLSPTSVSLLQSVTDLLSNFSILRIATELNIPHSTMDLERHLCHINPEVRLGALSVLLSSYRQTTPFSNHDFALLKLYLSDFFTSTIPDVRCVFLGRIRQLLTRLRASCHALNKSRNSFDKEHEFILWFHELLKYELQPESSYQRVLTTIHIIEIFFIFGLDDLVFGEQSSQLFPFKIKIIDDEMQKLLVDKLSDPFEDIRDKSMEILFRCKVEIQIEKNNLLDVINISRCEEYDGAARLLFLADLGYKWSLKKLENGEQSLGYLFHVQHQSIKDPMIPRIFAVIEKIYEYTKKLLCAESPEQLLQDSSEFQEMSSFALLLTSLLNHMTSVELEKTGRLYLAWINEIRHRGAFSALFPELIALSTFLHSSQLEELNVLPKIWIQEIIDAMLFTSRTITRRSGGLPMSLVALLCPEIGISRPLFKSTMSQLFKIAKIRIEIIELSDLPQIHALNSIRAIFQESKLSVYCTEYVSEALLLVIQGFSSNAWSIRNCALILFNTIILRAFGKHKSRDFSGVGKRMSVKSFFDRYACHDSFVHELSIGVNALSENKVETVLYPILSLLSRLDIGGCGDYNEMRKLVEKALRSGIWKIREIAAQALPALIPACEVPTVLCQMINGCPGLSQNEIHGRLLLVKSLVNSYSDFAPVLRNPILKNFDILVNYNNNPFSKGLVLELCTRYLLEDSKVFASLRRRNLAYPAVGAGSSFLEINTAIFRLSLAKGDSRYQNTAINAIQNGCYEAKIKLLDLFDERVSRSPLLVKEIYKLAFDEDVFSEVRIAALGLLRRLRISGTSRWAKLLCLVRESSIVSIREAAMALMGIHIVEVLHSLVFHSNCFDMVFKDQLSHFIGDEKSLSSRQAALASISAFSEHLRIPSEQTEALYFHIFDFLEDDDEDIREESARLVSSILSLAEPCSSLEGTRRLVTFLVKELNFEMLKDNLVRRAKVDLDLLAIDMPFG
ncbi:hypothetical protein NEOLI_000382 [Neolecta irregularis DAH-3]|uniref:Uncharacterized protein n=1 Tax=Neolecta irregularis (strain DAH-3) TaxID=1198029 RepID=A0A1U7LUF1_NEOID|nr:hypothetical protein NEOLI_000382 [Neolecta irregularis DAH-3]|eukprot:OLL26305.1 hypothetical protein NEOLI_000382 [Neolecta irregularis DAH-3]